MTLDLYHRKRRKSTERRAQDRSLAEDYEAFVQAWFDRKGEKPQRSGQLSRSKER